jgi:hypothetical protein
MENNPITIVGTQSASSGAVHQQIPVKRRSAMYPVTKAEMMGLGAFGATASIFGGLSMTALTMAAGFKWELVQSSVLNPAAGQRIVDLLCFIGVLAGLVSIGAIISSGLMVRSILRECKLQEPE